VKWSGDGVAAAFQSRDLSCFFANDVQNHSNFGTRGPKEIKHPGPRQQQHNHQTTDKMVWDQMVGKGCMDGGLDLPFLPCWYCKQHGEKGIGK
jgi:hypothetical protein